jgi:isoamylase
MALSGATGENTPSDDPFLVMLNAWWEPLEFRVPESLRGFEWRIEIDTNDPSADARAVDSSAVVPLTGRSLMLLSATQPSS